MNRIFSNLTILVLTTTVAFPTFASSNSDLMCPGLTCPTLTSNNQVSNAPYVGGFVHACVFKNPNRQVKVNVYDDGDFQSKAIFFDFLNRHSTAVVRINEDGSVTYTANNADGENLTAFLDMDYRTGKCSLDYTDGVGGDRYYGHIVNMGYMPD